MNLDLATPQNMWLKSHVGTRIMFFRSQTDEQLSNSNSLFRGWLLHACYYPEWG